MKREGNSFWISYSDLATGLMMVFMLLMVVLMYVSEQEKKHRDDVIQKVAASLAGQIRSQAELGEFLIGHLRPDDWYTVDPVSARLTVDARKVGFVSTEWSWDCLVEIAPINICGVRSEGAEQKVLALGTSYFCSLYEWESRRLGRSKPGRPTAPGAVRSAYVVSSADLLGPVGNTNMQISTSRALEVHNRLAYALKRCADTSDEDPLPRYCFAAHQNEAYCKENGEDIWNYAQERIQTLGTGHVDHCVSKRNQLDGNCESALDMSEKEVNDSKYRGIQFRVELSQSDLTGFIAEVLKIRAQFEGGLGNPEAEQKILAAAGTLSQCQVDENSLLGCKDLDEVCEALTGDAEIYEQLRCSDRRRPSESTP